MFIYLSQRIGDEIIDYLLQCVDDCYEYESPAMIVHLTSGDNPPNANDLCIKRINRIVERAEQKYVNIALEIMNAGYEHIENPSEFLSIAFERAKRLDNLR